MIPGQTPVRMDGKTFNELMVGQKLDRPAEVLIEWMVAFGAVHIEPIEDEL